MMPGRFPLYRATLVAILGCLVGQVLAADTALSSDPRALIAARWPEIRPEHIQPSVVAGLWEVRVGSEIAYVSADGRHLFRGDVIDAETDANLTEQRRHGLRRDLLMEVADDQTVIFAPAEYTSTIHVFTDIDCGYCRKLHREIAEYNARGIRVRYLFFPRSGPGTESWTKAEQVWCAADRPRALTRSKMGEVLKEKTCSPNPVARHYELGRDVGLLGTPAIVLESGELLGGYVPPAELARHIADSNRPVAPAN